MLKRLKRKRAQIRRSLYKGLLGDTQMTLVDVGAARGLQPHWNQVLGVAECHLFEPGPEESKRLCAQFSQYDNVYVNQIGVDETSGEKTLYLANEPTGSSLLPFNEDAIKRNGGWHYFYPAKEVKVQTISLVDYVKREKLDGFDFIKLDTQGTEVRIIQSMQGKLLDSVLGIEFELGLGDSHFGMPEFDDALRFMKENGFELYDMRTNRSYRAISGSRTYFQTHILGVYENPPRLSAKINEFDLIYFRNPKLILENKDALSLRKLLAGFCVYNFFSEAYYWVEQAFGAKLFTREEADSLKDKIVKLAKLQCRFYQKNTFVWRMVRKLLRRLRVGPQVQWAQYMHVEYPSF